MKWIVFVIQCKNNCLDTFVLKLASTSFQMHNWPLMKCTKLMTQFSCTLFHAVPCDPFGCECFKNDISRGFLLTTEEFPPVWKWIGANTWNKNLKTPSERAKKTSASKWCQKLWTFLLEATGAFGKMCKSIATTITVPKLKVTSCWS